MNEKIKTVVVYCEEPFRKECRHLVGKVEFARIVLEVSCRSSDSIKEAVEEMQSHDPQLFVVEFPKDRQVTLDILSSLNECYPQVPIIGAGDRIDSQFLIDAMRLGLNEVLSKPIVSDRVCEAFERIRRQVHVTEEEKDAGTVISFFSPKGGSGSTTVATNFAVSLGQISKKKVLVLDLDFELGEVANFFGIKNNKFLIQESEGYGIADPSAIAKSIVTHPKSGVDILSISDGLSRVPISLAAELRQLLIVLQGQYDYIVVDTSGILSESVVAVLDASHLIFLVSKCNLPALSNVQKVLHGFQQLGYSQGRVRLLINRYNKGEDISVKEIEKALNFKVFWCIPNDYKAMIRAIQSGNPLTTTKNQATPLAISFYAMSAQILGIKVEDQPQSAKGGLLVRIKESSTKSLPLTSLNLLKS
jgi:pilus assembly protein CpaE